MRCQRSTAVLGICLAIGVSACGGASPKQPLGEEPVSVDYRKIDAALAIELASGMAPDLPSLDVFIQLERLPTEDEAAVLRGLGLQTPSRGTILTGRVSPRAVAELSRQAWVRQIKLSQRLRPLGDEPE